MWVNVVRECFFVEESRMTKEELEQETGRGGGRKPALLLTHASERHPSWHQPTALTSFVNVGPKRFN